MKIDIFTGGTSFRSKNIFTNISQYPTGKHEIMDFLLWLKILKENEKLLILKENKKNAGYQKIILVWLRINFLLSLQLPDLQSARTIGWINYRYSDKARGLKGPAQGDSHINPITSGVAESPTLRFKVFLS